MPTTQNLSQVFKKRSALISIRVNYSVSAEKSNQSRRDPSYFLLEVLIQASIQMLVVHKNIQATLEIPYLYKP